MRGNQSKDKPYTHKHFAERTPENILNWIIIQSAVDDANPHLARQWERERETEIERVREQCENTVMASDSLAENGVQQELQVVNNCDIGGLNNDGPSSYGPPSPLTGCYLLIVLGEPHSLEHKDIILQRLSKGNFF